MCTVNFCTQYLNYRNLVKEVFMKINLFSILLCISSIAMASDVLIGDPLVLNTIYDEHIGIQDPRIRSVIYVTKHNLDSSIEIHYKNYDGKQIAKNLATIFDNNKLQFSMIEDATQQQDKVIIKIIQE